MTLVSPRMHVEGHLFQTSHEIQGYRIGGAEAALIDRQRALLDHKVPISPSQTPHPDRVGHLLIRASSRG